MMESQPTEQTDSWRSRRRAAWISLAASLAVFVLKAVGYQLSGSQAVLSDALESVVNIFTAGVALAVIRFASQPADDNHPYGHGKAEFVSAAFEGGLIAFAAVVIALDALRSFFQGSNLRDLDSGFLFIMVAAAVNLIVGLWLAKMGRRERSESLAASGAHVLSDVKTTVGVAIGLLIVRLTGWTWVDPLAALLVALHLGWEGVAIVRRSFGGLLDETDEETLKLLAEAFRKNRTPGTIEIHHLRAIRSGSFHHIDAHLVVPEFWDVLLAHEVSDAFESHVVRDYPFEGEIAFHLDPCRRQFCTSCQVPDCPIRRAPFERLSSFELSALTGDRHYRS